jgi:hypothetical protein
MSEVPRDVICEECALYTKTGRSPSNVMTCALPFHKKPSKQSIIAAIEAWIPGLTIASARLSVNFWMQSVNHMQKVERRSPVKEDRLIFDTFSGASRPRHFNDAVVPCSSETAFYVMQTLNIANVDVLCFYDSGANTNLVQARLAFEAEFEHVSTNTVCFKVAGGGEVVSDHGQYAAVLGPDLEGEYHEIECQAVEAITTNFPTFDLRQAVDEAQSHMGRWRKFPPKIGGAEVKLLIGIASTQLAPTLL